jgi:acyl-CoA synthetase (AMP-forming)/AMP-acid ligase II
LNSGSSISVVRLIYRNSAERQVRTQSRRADGEWPPPLRGRPVVSVADLVAISREHNPFARTGITIGGDGTPRYDGRLESLLALLEARTAVTPNVEAVVELGGRRLTYQQLWDSATRVAGGLRAAGVRRGDRVGLRYSAGANWVLAFWGTMMAGGIVVAVNTRSSAPEVEFVLSDAGVTVDLTPHTKLPDGEPYVESGIGSLDVAAIFYTSGTTGKPKGVPVTHEAFLTNAENMMRCLHIPAGIGADLRTLISVPLFHVTGCNSQLLVALHAGGTAVIMPALDQAALIAALPAERINFMVTVPPVYSLLLRHPELARTDVSGLRWVAYGGAPIAPTLVEAIQNAFPSARVFNGYGMTETASLLTVLPHEDSLAHADSVGYAVPSIELAVLPTGDDPNFGELIARGPTIMHGYWQRPDATSAALTDGWLHTGDIVRVDQAGRVHIVDRTKDIIIRGGENISSIEVESALVAAPGVFEAAVLAVPDEVMGEKVGAVVFGGEETVNVDTVIEFCRSQLADFKVPQYIQVATEPLPRNATGKLLKAELRDGLQWGAPLR